MSTESIYAAVLRIAQDHARTAPVKCHLDVGSGRGQLIERFRQRLHTESTACDYTDTLMKLPGQKVDVVNLNEQSLPYANAAFDILTATEVIEHLEHYRETLREFHRVLRPGGLCILTTPNVLSLNSRLRYLYGSDFPISSARCRSKTARCIPPEDTSTRSLSFMSPIPCWTPVLSIRR